MKEESESSKLNLGHTLCKASSSKDTPYDESRQFHTVEDEKWASYLHEDVEEDKPKMSIKTRMKVLEVSEEEMRKLAYNRGTAAWKASKIPSVECQAQPFPKIIPKPEKSANIEVKTKLMEFVEGSEKIKEDVNELLESKKRKDGSQHEEDIKKLRESLPREYFWKPDPLFYMHLKQLGYSKTEAEKALYYTHNKSVDLAEKYIQEHPVLTPLTRDEVMADAEEFLNEMRDLHHKHNDSGGNGSINDSPSVQLEESRCDNSTGEFEELSPHSKERIKPHKETESTEENVELLCIINSDCTLKSASLGIECSRATVKIMEELQEDKWQKLNNDWAKYGKCVNAYETDGATNLYQLQEKLLLDGRLSYLAEIQDPHSANASLPVVLCTLAEVRDVKKIYPRLSKVD